MTPECRNCGRHLTMDYVRVFSRDGDGVDACPWCPDRIREGGDFREARSTRRESTPDGAKGGLDE